MWPFSKPKALPRECLCVFRLSSMFVKEKDIHKLFKKVMPYLTEDELEVLFEDNLRKRGRVTLRLTKKESRKLIVAGKTSTTIDCVLVPVGKWTCCDDSPCDPGCAMSSASSQFWSERNVGLIRDTTEEEEDF